VVAPPLKKSVDLLSFASVVDGALLVVDADSTRRADALAAKQHLLAGGVPLLGAILDNHKFLPDWLYGHL
jgi:Mrp family chromosome partitioning ATPase